MFRAHAEYGLGEWAAFEFAHESRRIVHEAAVACAGAGTTALSGQTRAHSNFAVAGSGALLGSGATVVFTVALPTGLASSTLEALALQNTHLGASGHTAEYFAGGRVALSVLTADGAGSLQFDSLDGNGFDINAGASQTLTTTAICNTVFAMSSASQASFNVVALNQTAFSDQAQATTTMRAQTLVSATLSSKGVGGLQPKAQAWAMSTLLTSSAADFSGKAVALANTAYAIAGTSDLSALVHPKIRVYGRLISAGKGEAVFPTEFFGYTSTRLDGAGAAPVSIHAQSVAFTEGRMAGNSAVTWWRGRNVLPDMVHAADEIVRQAEPRDAQRGYEQRSVERPR